MPTVDQQSDALEQMEHELPTDLEEKEILASEGNNLNKCSSCNSMMNEGRQLKNTVKTLREKLKKKREALRAAQLKLKGMFSIQSNDYGSLCISRHFEIWRGMPWLFPIILIESPSLQCESISFYIELYTKTMMYTVLVWFSLCYPKRKFALYDQTMS